MFRLLDSSNDTACNCRLTVKKCVIYRLYHEQAFRDRSNPLDLYNDEELIERFRFCRRDLFELIEELSLDLRFVSDHSAALSPTLQLLLARCFYANGAFQWCTGCHWH